MSNADRLPTKWGSLSRNEDGKFDIVTRLHVLVAGSVSKDDAPRRESWAWKAHTCCSNRRSQTVRPCSLSIHVESEFRTPQVCGGDGVQAFVKCGVCVRRWSICDGHWIVACLRDGGMAASSSAARCVSSCLTNVGSHHSARRLHKGLRRRHGVSLAIITFACYLSVPSGRAQHSLQAV